MSARTAWLQIRVTAEQKRALKRAARQANSDVSAWVLGKVLPAEADRFETLVARAADAGMRRFALAELADWLRGLPAGAFQRATAQAPRGPLDPETRNYLAGAIELAAERRGLPPPPWVGATPVPEVPLFGSSLAGLRLHLLTRSPVVLRRRNVFVDASIDDRA
jgi:hypothetical protein